MKALLLLALLSAGLTAQTPTITSAVNYLTADSRLSPGILATVSGTNLAGATNMTVSVGGTAAAVISASATQILIQIGYNAPIGLTSLVVGNSAPFPITLAAYAPTLSTTATHTTGAVINASAPAAAGETIVLYATGLGATNPAVAAGATSPSSPLANTVAMPTVTAGGTPAPVLASLLTPGEVGLYQLSVQLPATLASGNLPFIVSVAAIPGNTVTLPVGASAPVISGVISATGIPGSSQPNIQAGSWVSIFGSNLSKSSLDWTGLISPTGALPTSVGGVSVTIAGKPAYVYYVSPGQLDVQAPDNINGSVPVVVTNSGSASAAFMASAQTYAPAFFQWGNSPYAVATRYPDNTDIANPTLGTTFSAASPGDVLILWATGFGPVLPLAPAGQEVAGTSVTTSPITATLGGTPITVIAGALSPGLAGVYQIALQLPTTITAGNVAIKASIGGFSTPDNVMLYVVTNH
jgi:uncharacterized protein (TIGR03437 family)